MWVSILDTTGLLRNTRQKSSIIEKLKLIKMKKEIVLGMEIAKIRRRLREMFDQKTHFIKCVLHLG